VSLTPAGEFLQAEAQRILGAVDDYQGVRGVRRGEGMRARTKLLWQIVLAGGAAIVLKYGLQAPELFLPNYLEGISLGLWYIPIAMFIIVASTNAVNFTDGLDGLAGLIAATAFAAYGAIAVLQGQVFLVRFCFIQRLAHLPDEGLNAGISIFPAQLQLFFNDSGSQGFKAAGDPLCFRDQVPGNFGIQNPVQGLNIG